MLDALNAIVDFFAGISNMITEFIVYSQVFTNFLWKSVTIAMEFLVYIPEPFLHFAVITLVLAVLGFVLKVVL